MTPRLEYTQTDTRYHALDSMRAIMMLLGIYLHVVVGYSGDGNWPYIDKHPTSALNFTLGIIHGFRMPAFYVLAGFFGALLWNRRGPASFFRNRGGRVVAPLIVFWALLYPAVFSAVAGLQRGWDQVGPVWGSGEWVRRLHPMHLWFLEYLAILYAIGALVAFAFRRVPATVHDRIHAAFRWALRKPYAPLLFALFSWLPLAAMRGSLKDCDGWTPEPVILLAYVAPFGFGWLLYHSRELLPRFERHIWWYVALAVPAFFIYGTVSGRAYPFIRAAGNVAMCWFLIFALTGLFLRYASRPSGVGRYMSDAAYWMYIMHLPVVVAIQVALMPVPLPSIVKIPIALALAVAVLVPSYDWMVRGTFVGVLLNGRRYQRGLPAPKRELATAA